MFWCSGCIAVHMAILHPTDTYTQAKPFKFKIILLRKKMPCNAIWIHKYRYYKMQWELFITNEMSLVLKSQIGRGGKDWCQISRVQPSEVLYYWALGNGTGKPTGISLVTCTRQYLYPLTCGFSCQNESKNSQIGPEVSEILLILDNFMKSAITHSILVH